MLEPYDGRLSRTVLRGLGAGNSPRLSDFQNRWGGSVVIPKLSNMNRIFDNLIYESMFIIDAAGPIARKSMLERLRLSDSLKRIAFRFLNEGVDATKNLFISFLPKQIIIPRVVRKNKFQSMSSLSVPSSFSSWAMDSIRRLVFFGERKR